LSTQTEQSESDAELIARFQAGDRSAFAALVRRWEGPLVRIAYRITGDLAEAEDLRQRVLLRLLESPGSVRRPERVAAWVRRAIVIHALTALRRRRRRERLDRWFGERAPAVDAAQPADVVIAGDQAQRLAEALLRLDPRERTLLSLRFDEDLTFSEIAAALSQPVTTVKSRVARAIERLRALLADPDELRQSAGEARS
jgi:RNA polymerase sigma-70 factor (ECF subfamily)